MGSNLMKTFYQPEYEIGNAVAVKTAEALCLSLLD